MGPEDELDERIARVQICLIVILVAALLVKAMLYFTGMGSL